jgi:hypothetical protein
VQDFHVGGVSSCFNNVAAQGYQCFVQTSLLGKRQTVLFQIQSNSGMVSSHLYQILYVKEEEEYLVANHCHVHHKGILENDLVNKKLGDQDMYKPFITR